MVKKLKEKWRQKRYIKDIYKATGISKKELKNTENILCGTQVMDKYFEFEHKEKTFELTLKQMEIIECCNAIEDLIERLEESKEKNHELEYYYRNRISYIKDLYEKFKKYI